MKAVILAGGKGTRLYPYTTILPKPLLPVWEKPILEHIIYYLKKNGINDIFISIGHLGQLIQNFFQDGSKWGVNISYSMEDAPLGTIAPLRLIQEKLSPTFLVINGDILTDLPVSEMKSFHQKNGYIVTVATTNRTIPVDFGVLKVNEQRITGFQEKPVLHYTVSMGLYLFEKEIFQYIPEQGSFGFDHLMKECLAQDVPIGGFSYSGLWKDLGRREDYENLDPGNGS